MQRAPSNSPSISCKRDKIFSRHLTEPVQRISQSLQSLPYPLNNNTRTAKMAPPQGEGPSIITITHTSSLDFTIHIPDIWHGPRPRDPVEQQPEPEPDWQKRWEELRDKDFEVNAKGILIPREHVRLRRKRGPNRNSGAIERANGQKSAAEAKYTLKEFLGVVRSSFTHTSTYPFLSLPSSFLPGFPNFGSTCLFHKLTCNRTTTSRIL